MNTNDLARAFCKAIRDYAKGMGREDRLQLAIEENARERDDRICHTHDFCDANMAMLEAVESLGCELDLQDEKMMRTVDQAWATAKAAGFDPSRIQV